MGRGGGPPQQSRVASGDFRAAFAKTPYLRVILGLIFHSLPSPVPLLCACSINWSRLDPCTWVHPRAPARGEPRGGVRAAQPHSCTGSGVLCC